MRANSQYLTLAMNVREITDSLIKLVEDNQEAESLRQALPKVLISLNASGERSSVQRLRESGAFGTYENFVTVNEVVKPEDRDQIVETLQLVLDSQSEDERRSKAIQAISFFDAIERRALYRLNHPQLDRRAAFAR